MCPLTLPPVVPILGQRGLRLSGRSDGGETIVPATLQRAALTLCGLCLLAAAGCEDPSPDETPGMDLSVDGDQGPADAGVLSDQGPHSDASDPGDTRRDAQGLSDALPADSADPSDSLAPADGAGLDAASDGGGPADDATASDGGGGDAQGDQGPTDTGVGVDVGGDPVAPCEGELRPLEHDATPPSAVFRRGPYLQSVDTHSAVVAWLDVLSAEPDPAAGDAGAEPAGGGAADAGRDAGPGPEGCVEYIQPEEPAQLVCGVPDHNGQYAVELAGLTPGAPLTYRAFVGERSAGPYSTALRPPEASPTRLVVFGDAHANVETLRLLSAGALQAGVHQAVAVGDMVSEPTPGQWDAFFEGSRALMARVPFWPVLGNHEGYPESYFDAFVVPGAAPPPSPPEVYYSVRWGDVWMGMLQLDELMIYGLFEGTVELAQVTWLQETLASPEATSARWRILFLHQPAWSRGWGHCDGYRGEEALRGLVLPMLADLGVDAIFSGHMHGYERGEAHGMLLVTTGGAGGGLDMDCGAFEGLPDPWFFEYVHHYTVVDTSCDRLVVEARTFDGRVIDHVERDHSQAAR